jgi:prepilin-type processing-associated H-X9-DG protein
MELLVVGIIVAGVVILVFPLLQDDTGPHRRTPCINNLKQIGLALAQYSSDYADRLPYGGDSVFSNMALSSAYFQSPKILICPNGKKRPSASFQVSHPTDALYVGYAYQVSSTTSLVWQADANDVVMWDQGVAGNACGPNGAVGLSWAPTSSHKGIGGNVVFNDGHVAWQTVTPTNMTLGCQNP